jgi:putative transposase
LQRTLRAMTRYPTDLSDAEWDYLESHLPTQRVGARPRIHSPRTVLDGIFYVLRSGCPWRLLPRDFPPWRTVYHYFRAWRLNGTWEQIHSAVRERLRIRLGRDPHPSAGVVDSQSANTTGVGGEARGYELGGKKVRGRKRHLLVDTEGLVVKAKVHSAKIPDQDGIRLLLESAQAEVPRLSHLWVDAGYRGRGKEWAEDALGLSVEIVHRTPKPTPEKVLRIWAKEWFKEGRNIDIEQMLPRRGFEVLPRRWVVERTFAWLVHNRRLSKDYERLCATGEAFVYIAMTRLMVRRLARV